jgi:osmotically-inducible protein OsmY
MRRATAQCDAIRLALARHVARQANHVAIEIDNETVLLTGTVDSGFARRHTGYSR